ncbi:MAG: ChaN family lipoprotein [Candidatus Rokubacteria bacterium]|nr:ChaN family lipoprotein [Candidatus Rokubacteria bacterium]
MALALAVLLAGCRSGAPDMRWHSPVGREHPLAGRIWDVARGRFVPEAAVTADIAGARYVLLGEKHDNTDHHVLQTRLLRAMVAAGRKPAVAFEMLTPAQAPALARHLAAHPRDAAGIAAAVDWEASGWPDWAMYEPIARVALEAGLPIVAANLDTAQARAVARDGAAALDGRFVERHALGGALPAEQERLMAEEIRASHCGHAPERMLPGMIAAQRARDARLADALLEAPGGDGAVLIAGSGHARRDRGAPAYLSRLAPGARVVAIALLEVEAGYDDPAGYRDRFDGTLPFDHVWFTPAVDAEDPCEKFRKSLEKLRRP